MSAKSVISILLGFLCALASACETQQPSANSTGAAPERPVKAMTSDLSGTWRADGAPTLDFSSDREGTVWVSGLGEPLRLQVPDGRVAPGCYTLFGADGASGYLAIESPDARHLAVFLATEGICPLVAPASESFRAYFR